MGLSLRRYDRNLNLTTHDRSAPAIGANRTINVTTANNRLVAVGEAAPITLPSGVWVQLRVNHAVITWRDNSNREIGFRVERCMPEAVCTPLGTAAANATSFGAVIAASAPFCVRVQAIGGTGAAAAADLDAGAIDGRRPCPHQAPAPAFHEYRVKAVGTNVESPYAQNGAASGQQTARIFLPLVLR